MPLPSVLATWCPRTKAATKLKNAAHTTAFWGERTRVETTVAIELAASWKPLRKSNASATRMMRTMSGASIGIAVAQAFLIDDVADDVREVLAAVAGLLEAFVDLLPLQDLDRLDAAFLEELGDHREVERVALVLELGDADHRLLDLVQVAHVPDQDADLVDLLGHRDEDLREAAQRRRRLAELEEHRYFATLSRWSRMSSRSLASERMSSRSNGVMKVVLSASKIWRVIRSPSRSRALSRTALTWRSTRLVAWAISENTLRPRGAGSGWPARGARGSAPPWA